MSRLSLILLCACAGPAGQQTDPPSTGPCLSIESPDPIELDGRFGPTEAQVTLRNACDEAQQITATIADGYEGRISVDAGQVDVLAGQSSWLSVTFTGEMIGSAFDVLTLTGDTPDRTFEIIATGPTPELIVNGEPKLSVRACPTKIALSIKQIGDGHARLTNLSVSVTGPAELNYSEVTLPVTILPDEPLVIEPLLTITGPDAQLDVVLQEELTGRTSFRYDIVLDGVIEVVHTVPAAPTGPALDVLLTIDRELASEPRAQVEPLLQGLLEKLGKHYDYRVVGLIRDDGCPLNRTFPFVDNTWDVRKAATQLMSAVDLNKERTSVTEGEYRLLDRVEASLLPTNTNDGGCSAWRRPNESLLTWHITAHHDLSDKGDATAHINVLRELVPFDDMVRVHGIAGLPPHGCDGAEVAERLWDAANLTGGLMTSTCSTRWSDAVRALDVEYLGDPRRVVLADKPLIDSIIVNVDGSPTDRWTSNGAVITMHFSAWDPTTQELTVRYVPASACPL